MKLASSQLVLQRTQQWNIRIARKIYRTFDGVEQEDKTKEKCTCKSRHGIRILTLPAEEGIKGLSAPEDLRISDQCQHILPQTQGRLDQPF